MTRIPLYPFNERLWHWVQALTILVLIVTGAEVHSPQRIRLLGFETAVTVHNAFALLLLLNAALGLFYFLASGLIRQYVPGEHEFTHLAIRQVKFYLNGIFRGEPHPMEHGPDNKLNPLQKVTYLAILNVLLPVQIITGVLIWGAPRWPGLTAAAGGLATLVPIHALSAWFFLAFVLMHVYLTTTGETPLSNIKAMITGYVTRGRTSAPETRKGAAS